MTPQLPANSRCLGCGQPLLWAVLPSGTSVPLDRSSAGPFRLIRGERLEVIPLSKVELLDVYAQQAAAAEAGQVSEQLYSIHPEPCRQRAKEIRAQQQRRSRRRSRRRTRR